MPLLGASAHLRESNARSMSSSETGSAVRPRRRRTAARSWPSSMRPPFSERAAMVASAGGQRRVGFCQRLQKPSEGCLPTRDSRACAELLQARRQRCPDMHAAVQKSLDRGISHRSGRRARSKNRRTRGALSTPLCGECEPSDIVGHAVRDASDEDGTKRAESTASAIREAGQRRISPLLVSCLSSAGRTLVTRERVHANRGAHLVELRPKLGILPDVGPVS